MNSCTPDPVFVPLPEDRFRFRCHKGISCFTECCAGLNLLLTPYDIVRLKSRLGVSSGEFVDRFTEPKLDEPYPWPMIRLVMRDDRRRSCPFVTPEGCMVYQDRPGACRIYPLGRAAMTLDGDPAAAREKFFLVREPHCKGFQEDREWTVQEWLASEGVDRYNAMNDSWLRILTSRKPVGPKEIASRKVAMFYMASYNLDRFRDFIFKSPFLERFEVEPETRGAIASDDTALMRFAFDWLRFSLFGEQTISPRRGSEKGST